MIEGITILAQETITPSIGAGIFAFIVAGLLLIAGIIGLIFGIIDEIIDQEGQIYTIKEK